LDIIFIYWSRDLRVLCVIPGVFIAEEFDGVGDHWSGGTATRDVQVLLEAFLNMSLRFVHWIGAAMFW
jgi:hypothetical protein